jgi:hypothetical protein
MDESGTMPLAYDRPNRARAGLFAGRFVALASLGIIFAAVFLLVDAAALLVALARLLRGTADAAPYDAFAGAFRVGLDGLLGVGSVAALARKPWARRLLRIFAKGQFLDAAITAVAMAAMWLALAGVFRIDRRLVWTVLAVFSVRCGLAWLTLVAWRTLYADFYFGTREDEDGRAPRAGAASATGASDGEPGAGGVVVTHVETRTPRFMIRGRDTATGHEVEYPSRAKTEDLARKSAAALGLEPESVRVEAVAPEAAEGDPDAERPD